MRGNSPNHLQRLVLQNDQINRDIIQLYPEQQHYLQRVLRLKDGDRFIALDGKGHWWLSELQANTAEALILEALPTKQELPVPVTLGIAMPKGNNIESVIHQTTELGVDKIVPLWSDRTIVKSGTPIGQQKLERWQRIAREATEQSLRAFVPTVTPPQTLAECLNLDCQCKYICVTNPQAPHLLPHLTAGLAKPQISTANPSILLLTGPEGGWTTSEVSLAIQQGFQPVSLGTQVLAAITAPVVALAIVSAVLQTHDCNQSATAPTIIEDSHPR